MTLVADQRITLSRWWPRLALLGILAVAAVLRLLWLDREGWSNQYYAATVQSMLTGWKAFFFACYDPECFVTVDKSPLGFWVQVAFAKVLGLSGVSLILPQALAGIASVGVLYVIVGRVFGVAAGLLAALALAFMPVSVATDRNNTIDALLVLVILLAALAVMRSVETGRLRWLISSFALIGLGFEIKMLQAYLVLPAVALVYLVAAPHTWLRRLGHLAAATVVLLAISLAWPLAVDLTPADRRPYVGGSQNNSVLELITGHNGLARIGGFARGLLGRAPGPGPIQPGDAPTGGIGAAPPGGSGPGAPGPGPGPGFVVPIGGGPGSGGESGEPGPFRLFTAQLAGQVSWLLPLALFGMLVIALRAAWRPRPDRRGATLVLFGAWLVTMGLFFSATSGIFHRYYLVMLAPALAALAGAGAIEMWRAYRDRQGALSAALPIALAVTAIVQAFILAPFPEWDTRVRPLLVIGAVAALLLAAAGLVQRQTPRLIPHVLTVIAMATLVAAPVVWAATPVVNAPGDPLPAAGPNARPGPRGAVVPVAPARAVQNPPVGAPPGPAFAPPAARPGPGRVDPRLVSHLVSNRGTARWIVATSGAMSASPLMLETGLPVMALGGFGGGDRIIDAEGFAALVRRGEIRFVLADELGPGPPPSRTGPVGPLPPPPGVARGGPGGRADDSVMTWVRASCVPVGGIYDCGSRR